MKADVQSVTEVNDALHQTRRLSMIDMLLVIDSYVLSLLLILHTFIT